MHPKTYREFERICASRKAAGRILEIGAVPSGDSLLCMSSIRDATEKIGINLDGPHTYRDFMILRGNGNQMYCFDDNHFDVVLCNAVLEHDKFFWKTLAEIRRVTKPGGLVIIGTPGYIQFPARKSAAKAKQLFLSALGRIGFLDRLCWLLRSTPTIEIHDAPGDYYRFSPQSFREVFFEGMKDVEVYANMFPPIIIGAGVNLKRGLGQCWTD